MQRRRREWQWARTLPSVQSWPRLHLIVRGVARASHLLQRADRCSCQLRIGLAKPCSKTPNCDNFYRRLGRPSCNRLCSGSSSSWRTGGRSVLLAVICSGEGGGGWAYIPATILVGVRRRHHGAPIAILHDTIRGFESDCLSHITRYKRPLGAAGVVQRRSEIRKWQLERSGVNIVGHCRRLHIHVSWDRDMILRCGRAIRRQKDLSASHIELRIGWCCLGSMKRKQFGTHQVVARCQILGDGGLQVAILGDQLLSAPFLRRVVVAILHNLEPAIARGVVAGRAVVHFLHVDRTGTLVTWVDRAGLGTIGPIAPFECDLGACFDSCNA